jgi:hypothetical protein
VWSVVTTSADRVRPIHHGPSEAKNDLGPRQVRSPVVAGIRAACTAAAAGLAMMTILVLVGWIAAPHPRLGLIGVLRTAAVLWLVGHHVAVQVRGAGRIGMLPLGLVLLPGSMLWWAGRSVIRGHHFHGARQVMSAALAVAVPYALIAGVLAIASRSALARASLPQAVLAGFVVAFAAAWFGAARALASWQKVGTLMSARSRSILAGSAGSLAVLGAAGTLTTAVALANHVHQFTAVYDLLDPGMVGAGLLLLAQLAYLPNAVLWGIAYMLGPGFAVGAGTIVSPTGSVIGPVPAFPLLAALPMGPQGSAPSWLAGAMLAVPYLAGGIGGLLVVRAAPHRAADSAAILGFCSGAASGAVLGVLAAFAGGPLGDGRLSAVGPSAWQVATVGALELGIAAAVSAGAACWWYGRTVGSVLPSGRVDAARATESARAPSRPSARQDSRQDTGHVIFVDRWATEDGATNRPKPSRGPSSLP